MERGVDKEAGKIPCWPMSNTCNVIDQDNPEYSFEGETDAIRTKLTEIRTKKEPKAERSSKNCDRSDYENMQYFYW